MGKNLKGLLIYPPNQLMDIETPRPDGSLGPLYLASELERRGYEIDILDASVGGKNQTLQDTFYRRIKQENGLTRIGMDFSEIAEFVVEGKYNFVGISSNFTPQTNMVFKTAKAIKKAAPNIPIFSGGVNARALKERFLATEYFEGICLTEGEFIFPQMIESFTKSKGLKGVPGVAYKQDGKIIINPVNAECFPKHLDELVMPAWEKLPFEKYEQILSAHGIDVTGKPPGRYAPIMTSRGCPFSCFYCHISEEKKTFEGREIGRYRTHSIERVIAEIGRLEELGVKKIFFEDDSLFANKKRAKEIFERVQGRGLSILNVNGVNIINLYDLKKTSKHGKYFVDYEFLDILNEAGFNQMVFPLESGSKRIQEKYASNKVHLEKMDLLELMRAMSDRGIKAPINTMIGFPDETEEEMKMSFDLSRKLVEEGGAPYVTFFHAIPFPGSKLYNLAIEEGHLDRNFDPDQMNWKNPVMKNTTVSPEKIIELTDKAWHEINSDEYVARRLAESAGSSHRVAV